jgi:hypothetical protein
MVDKAEFFRVADDIRAEGREPSQRSIRERLAKGGSFTALGKLCVEWSAERNYLPRPTKEDLPDHLRDKLTMLAADIWCAGRHNATECLKDQLKGAIAERDALRLALLETSTRADALEQMMTMRVPGNGGSREKPIQEPALADRDDNRAFWRRVIEEIFDLLGDRTLGADAIIAEMEAGIAAEAARRDRAWGPRLLAHKMRERVKRKRFFLEPSCMFPGCGVTDRF